MMGSMKKVIFLDKEKQLSNGKDSNPPRSKKKQRKGGSEVSKNFFPNVRPPKRWKTGEKKPIALVDSFFDKEKDLMELFFLMKKNHLKVQLARLKGAQNNKDLVTESFILH